MTDADAPVEAEPTPVIDPALPLKADLVIRNHMLAACAASIVPVPVVDMAAITVVQINMIRKLAAMHGKTFSESSVRNTIAALVGGVGSQSVGIVAGVSIAKAIPVVGWAVGIVALPTIVGASTYAIGRVFLRHFEEGGAIHDISADKMKAYYAEQRDSGKKVVASLRDKIHQKTAPKQDDVAEAATA